MYGESNMETYITICEMNSQWKFAVWLRNSNRGSVSTLRYGWGEKWERVSKGRAYMYAYD